MRTMNKNLHTLAKDYERIACAIQYLDNHFDDQPALADVAGHVGLSASHFQRMFSRWAGISPKRFLQYLTLQRTRRMLRDSDQSLLDTTYTAGMSSVSRLHDLYLHCEAMTPAEYRALGQGLVIHYGVHPTPFGRCLIGVTDRGVCAVQFVHEGDARAVSDLIDAWPRARVEPDLERTGPACRRIFDPVRRLDQPLYTLIKGTPFQIKVWEALLDIPMGQVTSYQTVAQRIHHPSASRAVANAVASNPLHFVIPCHRVIQASGMTGGYKGGPVRKKAIIGWEAARVEAAAGA